MLKNSIGSKQALAEAQKRAEALTSLGIVLFAPTTSNTRLSPSLPFSDLLAKVCSSCGTCVRSRGSLVQSSVKAVEDYSVSVSGFGISCLYNSLSSNEV